MAAEEEKSAGWVAGMLVLLVAYFGWSFLAADYFQHDPSETAREVNFWINSFAQLPKLPSVLAYGFRERLWIIGLVAGLEVAVLIIWVLLKKLEKELSR